MSKAAKTEAKDGKEKEGKHVQSLERALSILEVMAEEGAPIAVSDLAHKVELKVSTVHRLLATLYHRGYVEQDADSNKYKLGLKLLEIGNAALYYSDIRTISRPYMEELVEKCNETVNLAILEGNSVVYIDQVESNNLIIVKMLAQVGNRGPIHCTASGKAMLAFMPPERMEELLNEISFEQYTNETIVDKDNLLKELERIRSEGHSLDWGEREEHVRCVAAPIFNHEGRVVAGISISGPSNRVTNYYMKNKLVDLVKEAAQKISIRMGYNPKAQN